MRNLVNHINIARSSVTGPNIDWLIVIEPIVIYFYSPPLQMKCLNSEPFFIVSLLSIISSISSQSESVNRTNMLLPNQPAPDFEGTAVIGTEFHPITLRQFRGSYVLLVFYPLDFTFVCPTELIAFSERAAEFKSRGCQVIACSTDSIYSHLAWTKLDRKAGGLGQMNIPLLSDKNLKISRAYGVLDEEEGHAFSY
ncbi:Thioredoxin peroxidase [Schistosoma japonicum]|nr:Thioredoxin peroxidase [Schistosoma japonicum]